MKVLLIFASLAVAASAQNMVGGWKDQTLKGGEKDKEYWDVMSRIKSHHQELLSSKNFKLKSVRTQVVSGIKYEFTLEFLENQQTCKITVWEQPWANTTKVTDDTCHTLFESKRQELGGVQKDTDLTDPHLQTCLGAMLDSINDGENGMYRLVESRIISATKQVVAGYMYGFKVEVAPSGCRKNADIVGKTSADCAVNTDSAMARPIYSGSCWYRSWMQPQTEVLDLKLSTDVVISGQAKPKQVVHKNNLSGGDRVDPLSHNVLRPFQAKPMKIDLVKKDNIGGDDHDLIPHGKKLIGGDDHDMISHGKKLIGGDDHDMISHGKKLIGGDDHDMISHGKKLIGGDDHDMISHGKKLIGGDDHDMISHGKKLIGGDDHDMISHGKKLIGGDDHDMISHGKKLIGGDDHDLIPHGKKLIGGDDHDMISHGKKLIGGDDHDLLKHGKQLLGGDKHDLVDHIKNLIGSDGHDYVDHVKKLLGADGHDLLDHGKKLLGEDGHDLKNHLQKLIGGDDHDLVEHVKQLLGADKSDYVQHVSRKVLGKDGHDNVLHGKANSTKKPLGDGHDLCNYELFKQFKTRHQRLYGAREEEKRYSIFCDNMRKVVKLQETERGSAVYGASKFADLTAKEFSQYVGKKWDQNANQWMKRADIPKGPIPESFDWRDHGAVTPVKNQGSCGSCWAFSTTGNIEGQWAIKKRRLISLSEQELVDCDKLDEGCNGGLPSNAYKEIERLGGLETETEYSYKGEDEKCVFKKSDVKVYINDSVSISSNETEMASWLAANGPISIGINAFAMQFYMGGISHPWSIFCNPKSLDHGVLIVGYGVKDSEPYWVVKNSWGEDWGEKGYYLVYRGDGVCGLNTMCTSAVVN